MASASDCGKQEGEPSPRAARTQLEEALGKLDLMEEEVTPFVINDVEEGAKPKWMLAGKVLYRNTFHIQTIASALRPAWGNPRGLVFRSVGENMFLADFESQRDRDRVREGSSWHVSKNAVILEEFVEWMQPSELKFDKLQVWLRILNLPFNLRNNTWGKATAKQVDKNASQVVFDPVGGFLRARVTIDVTKPLRRGILIDSAARKCQDWYVFQYEHVPHFCFSCGRLGHSDLFCPNPGTRDANGKLPFDDDLRAPDERKKASSNENSSREQYTNQNSRRDTSFSSTATERGHEVTSPAKKNDARKRKGDTSTKVYRPVGFVKPPAQPEVLNKQLVLFTEPMDTKGDDENGNPLSENAAKKRKTPSNSNTSAEAAL
ncbi:hypothetical protein ACQ4PT_028791 [Festuca glaucescens]